ncbi:MAG TPA: ribosome recycling factor [Verrucomicrobiota bacterium]|nr:ribosome recycling factor [Verrucomicrobiota bacterium]
MPIDQVLKETEEKMAKSEAAMMHEFEGVRTGKANPALVENLMVEAYGSSMRMRDMAGITAPETRMILIQPWDAGTVETIAKSIQAANLGLNPAIDGKVIRLALPELSQERREELVKVAKKITEDGRIAMRHVRRDALDGLKKAGKEAGVSEDEIKTAEKRVQKLTDDFVKKLDAHLADKEKEILTV